MIKSHGQYARSINSLDTDVRVFSLRVLEHSFQLLRHRYPSLALVVQNITAEFHHQTPNLHQEHWVSIDLALEDACSIVTALSEIAEEAAQSELETQQNRIAIHQTLLDWLMYAQTFLEESAATKTAPSDQDEV